MPRPIQTIIVGIATLENDPVLRPALELAGRLGAELHVVHGFEVPNPVLTAYSRLGWLEDASIQRYGDDLNRSLIAEVEKVADDQRVTCHTTYGAGHEAVCQLASRTDADLILVGATRQGPMMRHILGSTADRVIRSACAPVLVLRPPFEVRADRVLLTCDLSPLSDSVFDHGVEVVGQLATPGALDLRCLVVAWYDVELPPPLRRDLLEEVVEGELNRFLAEHESAERPVEPRVRIGDPVKEIVAEAIDWQADLVVVGTQGRPNPSRYILGSVAASVLRSALCNVLVIPVTAPAGEEDLAAPTETPTESPAA